MLNIFGKLYTLLRRPQQQQEEAQQETPEEPAQDSDWELVKADSAVNISGTDVDLAQNDKPDNQEDVELTQVARNDTMDMEAMTKLVEEMQATGDDINKVDTEVTEKKDAVSRGKEQISGVSKKTDRAAPLAKGQKSLCDGHKSNRKPCKFFSKGSKCYKGNRCPFSHDLDTEDDENAVHNETVIKEEDFRNYNDFVMEMTKHDKMIFPKELLYKLGYQKCGMEAMGSVLVGQYKLAVSKNKWNWVGQARYFAELLFPQGWIEENLPTKDGKKLSKPKDKQKKKKSKFDNLEKYQGRGGMCQDVRLLENPNLPVMSSNFGNKRGNQSGGTSASRPGKNVDEFVNEYTNEIINEAVRLASEDVGNADREIRGAFREALDGGLSESLIMEVIDDVTVKVTTTDQPCMSSQTPSKRAKVNKPDTQKTPRKRPEELAVGFNYLSSELVKHSPKTLKGGIICMDTLPPSQERPEQLAFGFNFHADKLVKESPKAENGDILIPGVVLTLGGRKARDQLAMGFNYHSNVIVSESPKGTCNSEHKPAHQGRKKKLYTELSDENQRIDHRGDGDFQVKRKQEKERLAIGFSKNADLLARVADDKMVVNVLGEKDINVSTPSKGCLDSSFEEEKNASELDDSFVPTMVPAGSLVLLADLGPAH